jgi:hypothetical protein
MAETGKTESPIQGLKRQLERLGAELEAVSAEIWRNIDHDDAARLEQGVAYKQHFNQRRGPLETAVSEMLAVLRDYPLSDPGPGEALTPRAANLAPAPTPISIAAAAASGGVSALRPAMGPGSTTQAPTIQAQPVTSASPSSPLVRDLGQKVPFGFVLGGQTFTSASAWPLFYEALLEELYERNPEQISRLADDGGGFLHGGKALFARLPGGLDDPLPVAEALFAEADLSPEDLLEVIKSLLREIGYPLDAFKILLKEKNRGTVETLSIAA